MFQISNNVYCNDFLLDIDIENKVLPNCYKNYPYLILKNFISHELAKKIISHIKNSSDIELAKVKSTDSYGLIQKKIKQEYRKTNIYTLNNDLSFLYLMRFKYFQEYIEEFFNISLTTSTDIQALEYQKGCFYTKHADDSSEIIDQNGTTIGFKNIASQRKLTTVLFCTSHDDLAKDSDKYLFSGGELLFNYLYDYGGNNIKLKPQAGDMIVFPSNPYFSHEVLKVQKGYRLTLVQWHDAIIH